VQIPLEGGSVYLVCVNKILLRIYSWSDLGRTYLGNRADTDRCFFKLFKHLIKCASKYSLDDTPCMRKAMRFAV
jgi:hypothetical protein